MAELRFMKTSPMDPSQVCCPKCGEAERIGVHQRAERRYKCHGCESTFAETKGSVFEGIEYPGWVVVLVVTLLAHGCPPAAIVAAFLLDPRTVSSWLAKAGEQAKEVQEALVCGGGVELGQVQADELRVKTQGGTIWIATARCTGLRCLAQRATPSDESAAQ